jgi:hypothetical protein
LFRFSAAITPNNTPKASARQIASNPSVKEIGKPELIKSFTVCPLYLNDGPKSHFATDTK